MCFETSDIDCGESAPLLKAFALRLNGLLAQYPPFAVFASEEFLGVRSVGELHIHGVPLQLFPGTVSDVPEMVRLGQRAGVREVARCGSPRLAGMNPLGMMAE